MQPVRLRRRSGAPAERPAAAAASPVLPPHRPRRPSLGRSRKSLVLALLVLNLAALAWAGAATYGLFHERALVATLRDEQLFLQRTYDEKVRALTRRLVGAIASQPALEKDGLDGRLADLITRQVELETRQLLLGGLTGQAIAPVLPEKGASLPMGGAVPTGGEALLDRLDPAQSSPERRQVAALNRASEDLPLAERIAVIEQSLDRVDSEQTRQVSALAWYLAGRVQDIRAALAELGLDVARVRLPIAQPAMGGPLVPLSVAMRPGSFEHRLQQFNESRLLYGRWRDLATIVPLQRPLEGDDTTTSNFGPRIDPFTGANAMHAGMDFRAETGTPVRATGAGKVLRAEMSGGYGNLLELDHGNGLTTRYGHLTSFDVTPGQIVAAGTIIGRVGSTGRSTGPHLHYETRHDDEALNPLRFIQIGARLSQGVVMGAGLPR